MQIFGEIPFINPQNDIAPNKLQKLNQNKIGLFSLIFICF